MNDAEIAAVLAAAALLRTRDVRPPAPTPPGRWARAARWGRPAPADAWIVASRSSTWTIAGRRDD